MAPKGVGELWQPLHVFLHGMSSSMSSLRSNPSPPPPPPEKKKDNWVSTLKGSTDRREVVGPVPNVVGCPKGLLKDFRAVFVGALALGVEVPTGLGSTFGSRVGSLTTSVVVETAPGVMPALFSHHHRTAPCSGPDTRYRYQGGTANCSHLI